MIRRMEKGYLYGEKMELIKEECMKEILWKEG
jgi:hypothetical protein